MSRWHWELAGFAYFEFYMQMGIRKVSERQDPVRESTNNMQNCTNLIQSNISPLSVPDRREIYFELGLHIVPLCFGCVSGVCVCVCVCMFLKDATNR